MWAARATLTVPLPGSTSPRPPREGLLRRLVAEVGHSPQDSLSYESRFSWESSKCDGFLKMFSKCKYTGTMLKKQTFPKVGPEHH